MTSNKLARLAALPGESFTDTRDRLLRESFAFEADDPVLGPLNRQVPPGVPASVALIASLEACAVQRLRAPEKGKRFWAGYLAARLNAEPATLKRLATP